MSVSELEEAGESPELQEEFSALSDEGADDDARWCGFALSEVTGAAVTMLLDGENGVVYARGGPEGERAGGKALAAGLLQAVEGREGVVRAQDVVQGEIKAALRRILGLQAAAEGAVLLGVGARRVLVVAPDRGAGRFRRSDAVWLERAANLLVQEGKA